MSLLIEELIARRRQEELHAAARGRRSERADPDDAGGADERGTTPMTPFTRLLFWFVGLNALAGAASLLLFPHDTASLFFWPIAPALGAALFGALYLGGGVASVALAWHGRWEPARALVPVLVAAGLLISAVTLAHLGRFSPGPRLAYWLGVYAGAPALALAAYRAQERRGGSWEARTPLAPAARRLAAATGAALLGAGALILVRPEPVIALWPWPTTPLTLRIFAAWFSAFGVGLLWFLVDGDWGRLAMLPRLLVAAAGLDLAVLVAHRGDLTTTGPRLWLYVAHLVGLAAVGCLLHWLQRRPVRARAAPVRPAAAGEQRAA